MADEQLNATRRSLQAMMRIALLMVLATAGCVGSAGCDDDRQVQMRTLSADGQQGQAVPTLEVMLDGRPFVLELALDSDTRYQGLSDRQHIPDNGGMLFVFPTAQRLSFVMRRCLVPIDIAFLDPAGRVVAMHEMKVEPYDTPERQLRRYGSRWPAQYAIEVKGGTWRELDLKVGDQIELPLEELREMTR